jgi:hypothetical protein
MFEMKIKKQYLLAVLLLPCFLNAQIYGSKVKDFEYISQKIESNYPGYAIKADQSYHKLKGNISRKILSDTSEKTFFHEMSKLILFFKDMHLTISKTQKALYDSSECKMKYTEILNYFKRTKLDKYEGIWKSEYNDALIGVIKEGTSVYKGYMLVSTDKRKIPGSIKFIMRQISKKIYQTDYYASSGKIINLPSYFVNSDTLLSSTYNRWIKQKERTVYNLSDSLEFKPKTEFRKLDSNFVLFKIPISSFSAKEQVDSLVKFNLATIDSSKYLIIDMRNNTGGTWLVYLSLLPYIYTNPIVEGKSLFRCSDDLISYQRSSLETAKNLSQENLKYEKSLLDSMVKYKNGFYEEKPNIIEYDSIKKLPKRVFILYNYRCVSASELFIKFCQQSTKVTLVGEKTWGAADYLEFVKFTTPSSKYEFYIPRLRAIFPDKKGSIDNKGIVPDWIIPYSEKDWIKFITQKVHNNE